MTRFRAIDPVPMAIDSPGSSELAAALRGQYALERELGRGGMGIVYLARDLKLDRRVAIKTLPPHLAHDEKMRERFLREARTAAALSHPNIVPIHRADEIDGQVFFVMGFVDGESLAQRVERHGPMTPGEVVQLLREVAAALHEAHGRGIIHRDVKAENILLDGATGRAMVTDFGIARLAEATPLTVTGLVLGTVHYMSPEHVSGEKVDARSDVYSLGIVAFYALAGRFPFPSESAYAVLVAHVTKPPPGIREVAPSVPAELAVVVDRCLAKEPSARFASCAELSVAVGDTGPRIARAPAHVPAIATERAAADALISETEARAVWERAARLQEQTLGIPAPDLRGHRRGDLADPLSPSSAFRLDVVRKSAREAGIATEFVDRVLVERGHLGPRHAVAVAPLAGRVAEAQAPASVLPGTSVRDVRGPTPSLWTGGPSEIEFEAVVNGEMPERDFDWLVETIRRTLGDVGTASTVGRSMSWSAADPKRQINVSVHVRSGRTTIHVAERLSELRGKIFGGGVGGFGGGFGGPAIALTMRAWGEPFAAFVAAAGVVAIAYAGSRFVYRTTVNGRRRILGELAERLAAEAESSIRDLAAPNASPYLAARSTPTREGT